MIGKKALRQLKASNAGLRAINVLRVASAVSDGETITIGSDVYEVDTNGAVTEGNILVDLSAGGTKSFGTLTLADNAANGETVTIGTTVYTFKTTLADDYDVLVGAAATNSIDNLIAAINGAAGEGTLYGTGTVAHTLVTAAAGAGDTMVVTARVPGTGGDAIATTETMGDGSFGAATLASGAQPTATQFGTAFVAAVNARANVVGAEKIGANEVLIYGRSAAALTTACTETLAGSNNAFHAAAMFGGVGQSIPKQWSMKRAAVAAEVTMGNMHFVVPFTPGAVIVQVRASTGAAKAWGGIVATASNGRVTLTNNASTDFAATDVVTVLVTE